MKVAILLGSPDISGGTYVIFQHALYLQRAGDAVTIVTQEAITPERLAWHPDAKTLRIVSFEAVEGERFDLAIGTWWRTLFELHRIQAASFGYFAQSIESRFYPESEAPLRKLVDSTYWLPLPIITEARWIKSALENTYSREVFLAPNGIRKDLYRQDGPAIKSRTPGRLRVLIEGPIDVPFKNVPKAIELAHQAEADEIWLLTISPISSYPGVDRVFSQLPIDEVPPVYRSCDVIVKLSYVEGMFGPPLEMFHCGGTAITFDVTGHDEYIVHDQNALVAAADQDGIVVEHLRRLRGDQTLLSRLVSGALITANDWPDWDSASRRFREGIVWMAEKSKTTQEELAQKSGFLMEFYAIGENFKKDLANTSVRLESTLNEKNALERDLNLLNSYSANHFLRAATNRFIRDRFPRLHRQLQKIDWSWLP